MNQYDELLNLNNKVQQLIKDDVDWEIKYDLIFSKNVSRRIFTLLSELNIRLDYYDPDTSYEEDALAFANALNEKIEELKKVEYMFKE